MRTSSTSSLSLLSLALYFYSASLVTAADNLPLPLAEAATSLPSPTPVRAAPLSKRRLSDQNLFEVHLANPASSPKRLPSKKLNKDHQERAAPSPSASEITASPASATTSSSSSSSALAASSLSSTSVSTSSLTAQNVQITFVPEQPSHLIRKHRHRNRRSNPHHHDLLSSSASQGKRRLAFSESDAVADDEEDLDRIMEEQEDRIVPATVTISKDSTDPAAATGAVWRFVERSGKRYSTKTTERWLAAAAEQLIEDSSSMASSS